MKTRKHFFGMALFAIIALVFTVATSGDTQPGAVPLHSKWPFLVGAAVTVDVFNPGDARYSLLEHYNVLVGENVMKPESIMPVQWQNTAPSPAYDASQDYQWTEADKLVNYAEAHNTKIRGHTLFWHAQTPEVFFRTGNLTSPYVSKEVLYTRMEQHVKTVFQKYGGRVLWWDVVNEPVGDDGNPRITAPDFSYSDKSGFAGVMEASGITGDNRYEWVANAFKYARKYANENGGQDVKLFLNETNIEGSWAGTRRKGFLRLLDYLIANNVPIDGVGIQGHNDYNVIKYFKNDYVRSFSSFIDEITKKTNPVSGKKLIVQATELDISLFAWNDSSLTLPASTLKSRLQEQANMYRRLFDMFAVKHKEGKFEMALFWGLDDGHTWLNGFPREGKIDHPLLFDRQYQPKPAFNSLITGKK